METLLRQALSYYGQHMPLCNINKSERIVQERGCNCGFDQWRKQAHAAIYEANERREGRVA